MAKADDVYVQRALDMCHAAFRDVSYHLGDWGDPLPDSAMGWSGEYVISYLARWVLPERLLDRAARAAINFHPAPPEYPGIGCSNFALYDGVTEFGVTCHHMAAAVDTGAIIAVKRFAVLPDDTVGSLQQRAYEKQFELFSEIVARIAGGNPLPESQLRWSGNPHTRAQLDELARVTPDMEAGEIARRVRATNWGAWKPTVDLGGFVFELKTDAKGAPVYSMSERG